MSMSNQAIAMSRRSFVIGTAAAGGGLALGLSLPLGSAGIPAAQALAATPEVNAWVVIKPDDSVVIRVARSEMGQGTITGLCQLVAEELECDWSKVAYEYPTPGESVRRKQVWGAFGTVGSRGIRTSQLYVRKGGAAARMMLIQAAADQWKVPAGECTAADSVITHTPSGRKLRFGEVAEAASKLQPPTDVPLKDPGSWKIAGKPLKRLDTADKVVGKQVYGIDLKLPGMLNAAIKQAPVFGGKVKSYDAAKVTGMPGVRHVLQVDDNAVAVVADTWWRAKTALEALPVEFDDGGNGNVTSASIAAMLAEGLDAEQAFVGNQSGDVKTALAGAARKVEAVYAYPYQSHAPMEPQNATALYTPDKCEAWVPTQDGENAFAIVLAASGLPADKCEVYKLNPGGGFGRRAGYQDYVRQAVLIARQIPGIPIKLLWSREEDMTHDHYHPVMQCKLTGGFDAANNLTALHMRLSGQSIIAGVFPQALDRDGGRDAATFQGVAGSNLLGGEYALGYTVPNLLVDHAMRNTHVPPGFWRGVNINQNCIFMECFIDELAQAVGQDELEFRRKLMASHPKHLAVLDAVAERIGWTTPAPQGVHRGLAQMMAFGAYVAAATEISVERGNRIRIHRIVAATDPAYAVNPAQIERQIAGSFVYGLSALFYGEITIDKGRVVETNFDTYDSMRIAQMPPVESIIMPSGGDGNWGGIGEPTICVAAPAVLNAYAKATGQRIRSFPLKNQRIRMA